jgi:hypothetical protein
MENPMPIGPASMLFEVVTKVGWQEIEGFIPQIRP